MSPEVIQLLVLALAVTVLVGINGLFVAAEISLVGARRPRIRRLAAEGDLRASRVLELLEDPDEIGRYFAVTQVGITLASIGLGMYGEQALADLIAPQFERFGGGSALAAHTIATPIAIVFLTAIHVVLGEMIPKALVLRQPEQSTFRLLPIMETSRAILMPAVSSLNWLARTVVAMLPLPPPTDAEGAFSAEELGRLITHSAERGLIGQRDLAIALDVIGFGERTAHQVMTPRTRMDSIPLNIDERSLTEHLSRAQHTRFPVFGESVDQIVGVLHLKDFLRDRLTPSTHLDLGSLIRKAHPIPEHTPLPQVLEHFKQTREHLAIVFDEYGGTAGLVTLEDVIEELVGEVRDEFDVEIQPVRTLRPGLWAIRGDVQLLDLEIEMGLPEERPDADTIGGLVVNLLGRPARPGDRVELGDMRLVVQSVDGLRVDVVLLESKTISNNPTSLSERHDR